MLWQPRKPRIPFSPLLPISLSLPRLGIMNPPSPNKAKSKPKPAAALRSFFRRKNKKRARNTNATSSALSLSASENHRAQIEEELKEVFKKFDVNGDGKVSASELGAILRSLGYTAAPDELESMIKEVDGDGDGCINLDEFIDLNTKDIDSNEAMESLKEAFLVFDLDKNGFISAEELQNVLKSLGDECSIAECRKMISGVDADGDGTINFDEFRVMMVKGSRFDSMGPSRQTSLKIE